MDSPDPVMTSGNPELALYPPQVRQPYTPPPPKGASGGEEAAWERKTGHGGRTGLNLSGRIGLDRLGICASPAGFEHEEENAATRQKRSKTGGGGGEAGSAAAGESLAGMLRKGIVEHQLGLSVNLILLAALSWLLFPSLRDRMEAYLTLSYRSTTLSTDYYTGSGALYGQGPRDLHLVLAFIILFTGVRAFMLDHVFFPFAGLVGVKRLKLRTRFAEQAYLLLYYIIYWSWGVYLFVRDTPAAFPTSSNRGLGIEALLISLWTHFPRLLLDGGTKLYYLSQLAFWIQQIIVIHLEERRKDHYQMLMHHFVTVALMSTSYGDRQWRVGTAVLVCMDVVDLIFPLAKILKYVGLQTACDIAFGLFVVIWLACRHIAYLSICYSVWAHMSVTGTCYGVYNLRSGERLSSDGGLGFWKGMFQPFVSPGADTVAFNQKMRLSFLTMLLGLQCITLMWFVMICRVVARVLRGEGADDSRSDDEEVEDGDEEDDEDEECEEWEAPVQASAPFTMASEEKPRFIEVEASSADYQPRRAGSSSGSGSRRKAKGAAASFSSGIHLGDHKEILNRIGCLSDEQLARERVKREGGEGASGRPRSR